MTARKLNINDLRIASPCPMNWENMTGDDRTRFCESCRLSVYNIAGMTEREVRALITKSEGRICARIFKRADGSVITRDCPVGIRAYRRRAARFAGAALATIIGVFSVAFGQTNSKKEKICKHVAQGKILREEIKGSAVFLKGTITDEQGAVVPGATVKLVNEATKKESSISSDENGEYKFSALSAGVYTIEFGAAGFVKYTVTNLEINKNEAINFDAVLRAEKETVLIGVVGDLPLIDSTSNAHTRSFDSRMIQKLPFEK